MRIFVVGLGLPEDIGGGILQVPGPKPIETFDARRAANPNPLMAALRYNAYANATPGVLYSVTPGMATRYPHDGFRIPESYILILWHVLTLPSKVEAVCVKAHVRFCAGGAG
jgi:hypothetical protein